MKEVLHKDPFAKMKISLAKSVLTGPDPSVEKLEQAFMEEFGAPPPKKLVMAFIKRLPPGLRPKSQVKSATVKINLIHEQVDEKISEQMKSTLEASGGAFVTLAFEEDVAKVLPALRKAYGLETNQELIEMALKVIEQQARGAAPELFENVNKKAVKSGTKKRIETKTPRPSSG